MASSSHLLHVLFQPFQWGFPHLGYIPIGAVHIWLLNITEVTKSSLFSIQFRQLWCVSSMPKIPIGFRLRLCWTCIKSPLLSLFNQHFLSLHSQVLNPSKHLAVQIPSQNFLPDNFNCDTIIEYSAVEGCLGCPQLLAITNGANRNIPVYFFGEYI